MSKIIDGRLVAGLIKAEVAEEVKKLKQKNEDVCLAVIIVGEDPASKKYVNNKKKACNDLGIISKEFIIDSIDPVVGQTKLLELITELNNDPSVNGILCQLPLPKGYSEKAVIEAIDPLKDVDAFHPINVGKIVTNNYDFLPCTPAGIMEMLDYYNIDITGKECVVVGRSNIVGKPAGTLLLHRNGTVTTAHSKTKNLAEVCRRADILIVAAGKEKLITSEYVKEGAVMIDVGINFTNTGTKPCGDVDFDDVIDKVSAITPVPGGVGPMTIAMLMKNTLTAKKLQLAQLNK